jgi:hypothetical protein
MICVATTLAAKQQALQCMVPAYLALSVNNVHGAATLQMLAALWLSARE